MSAAAQQPHRGGTRRISNRTFALAALVVALVLAAGVSYYASAHPDGLNRVAADEGFSDKEKQSAAADSPFAGYATKDVGNDRISGGLAGAVGVVVVLVLAGGLAYVVRRRRPDPGSEDVPSGG